MKCDIFEKDNKVFIEMDVPGYDKKDIKVECNKGNIVVNNYDKQQYFDIKESYIDYEDDKASNIFKEYKDNYDGLNQARIDKILRERNE